MSESRYHDEIREKPQSAWGLNWPVFPVKLSTDREEILAARDETRLWAQDPDGVNLHRLIRWTAPPAKEPDDEPPAAEESDDEPPPAKEPDDELQLDRWGFVIPTSLEPERTYTIPGRVARPLDAALNLDLGPRANWASEIFAFIQCYGLLGSTRRLDRSSAWRHGERVSSVRSDLSELQSMWTAWLALRGARWRELPVEDRRPFPPHVDRMAISELLLGLSSRLRGGVHPWLRRTETDDGQLRFSTGFTCETLSDALFFQLYLDITESREYAKCRRCDSFFARSHGNMAYCSPACSNAHRQQQWRKRQRRRGSST